MTDEIQLISDGDGVAVIGAPGVVERFLASEGLPSRALELQRLAPAIGSAAAVTQAGAEIAANAGRWVKLTEKSAKALNAGELMKGSSSGVGRAVLTKNGKITGILEIVKGPGALLTNPAILTGAAGIMAQLAMQQAMDEITDYLAKIDAKLDDVLRAQKDAVLADMIGVDLVIEEALTIREEVGRVSEVTWSKVQATSMTIARTQAYALRALDAIAEKLEKTSKVDDLADAIVVAESSVREWLAVLAQCFRLQDGLGVLELDRVLDASPEELDRHRIALKSARRNRLNVIATTTRQLLSRMDAAAATANISNQVLLNPFNSRKVVTTGNQIASGVLDFQRRLGIESDRDAVEAMRWRSAIGDVRDKAIETGVEGAGVIGRFGSDSIVKARSLSDKVALKVAEGALRRRGDGDERAPETSAVD